MAKKEPRIASFKRRTWNKFDPLPPAFSAIKQRLEDIADAAPAPSKTRKLVSRG